MVDCPRDVAHINSAPQLHTLVLTAEEDALILATVAELGSKWARIASLMPQRTEHGVRNRYNRLMLLAAERQAAAPPTGA